LALSQEEDPGSLLFENLIIPGDRLELWFPDAKPGYLPPCLSLVPDAVICGKGGSLGDVRHRESHLRWLEHLCTERRPDLILFSASTAGHELGTRLSARLGCGCFPETRMLLREGKRFFARKRVCSSNLEWDAGIENFPAVLTVVRKKPGAPLLESRPAEPFTLPEWLLEYEQLEVSPSNPLEIAPLIFAAGRGMENRAACEELRHIAGRFGAPLGFSRPAALNGWGGIGEIIGQSGICTGAEICIAVGVSGAAAFMAGIESVHTLIAVNTDKNAPMFHYADIGIIARAEEFIAALEILKEE
jgi:electron transfer flavoprotein alpha subunit